MILVHDIFIAKPGNGSKLAKLFKEVMSDSKEFVNVITDVTGQFNKVVVVSKFESLTAYEQNWEEMQKDTALMEKMKTKMAGYHDMYLTGSREIYQIW
jgi:hypothetical protein